MLLDHHTLEEKFVLLVMNHAIADSKQMQNQNRLEHSSNYSSGY